MRDWQWEDERRRGGREREGEEREKTRRQKRPLQVCPFPCGRAEERAEGVKASETGAGGDAELASSRQESGQEPFWALSEAIARPELLLDERCQGVAYGRDRMLRTATKNCGHVGVIYGNASPASPEFGNPACVNYRASSLESRAILRVQHPSPLRDGPN